MEERFVSIENRLTKLEGEMTSINNNTDEILKFVKGANKIWGIASKNWKAAIIFGAGIMTSAGIGNPQVWRFVSGFFGGSI